MNPKNRFILTVSAAIACLWMVSPAHLRSQNFAGPFLREHVFGQEVVAGEVLVRFRDDAYRRLSQIERDLDADNIRPLGDGAWRRIHSASRSAQALLTALSARADVLDVEPNYIVHSTAIPNDPLLPTSLWGLINPTVPGADIHAANAWNISTGSANIVVGVIDSGAEFSHPDLAANLWTAPSSFTVNLAGGSVTCPAGSHGLNAITLSCIPGDDNGHGTHTSGTVGAVGNNGIGVVGVNWTTRMMVLKFLNAGGSGSTSDAIDAIDFAIQAKAAFAATNAANVRVLSNSWGGGGFSVALRDAIQRAATANMLFVAAAGNSNQNNDAVPFYPASYTTSNVVAVAATDAGDAKASFSSYGAMSVDLGAPGAGIVSTYVGGGYASLSGTSMATPHVAGAAALVLSACNLNTTQLKAALLNNVDVIPSMTGIVVTNGRLNADRAIRSCATVPTVSLTSPVEGASFTAPASITVAANATDPDGISRVEFYQATTLIGTATSSPYGGTWSPVAAGSYTLTAKAYDTLGVSTVSAPVHVTVTAPGGGGASATFVGTDTTTQGNWRGVYGADGYHVVNDAASYPAYATVTPSGQASWTWAASTSEVRALQRASGTGRIAATWYGGTFSIDINVTDGAAHAMTLYAVDWDPASRVERFDVRDAVTGALLDTRTAAGFTGGQYWTWTVRGHVTVQVTLTGGGGGAVVSGVFFDSGSVNVPPVVTMTGPVEGATAVAPATFGLQATASDSDGLLKVEFYEGANLIATSTNGTSNGTTPYTATWSNVPAGSYTLTAKAYDTLGVSTVSAPVHVTVTAPGGGGATATFVGTDTTTQGNWRGVYGADGYHVINDTVSYPAYATVTPNGQASWTWAASTSEVRALQRASGTGRIAATWYGGTFSIDINVTDGAAHAMTLYGVDWDPAGRVERFDVRDAVTGALLDTRTAAGFTGGQYWTWTVRGHVTVQVTLTGGGSGAVVGGVFFDGGGSSSGSSATFIGTDMTRQGNWQNIRPTLLSDIW